MSEPDVSASFDLAAVAAASARFEAAHARDFFGVELETEEAAFALAQLVPGLLRQYLLVTATAGRCPSPDCGNPRGPLSAVACDVHLFAALNYLAGNAVSA